MERLTRKSLEYKDTWIADGSLSNIEGVVRGNAIDRLAELEDVLEKYGIENLEEYISALIEARKLAIKEKKTQFKRYIEEVTKREKLEQELAELKQKAIVPKFQIRQHIWLARNNVFQKEPCELIVQNIEYHFKTGDFLYIVDFVEKGHHKSIIMCDNGDLFATLEEAELKLAQLKGKE